MIGEETIEPIVFFFWLWLSSVSSKLILLSQHYDEVIVCALCQNCLLTLLMGSVGSMTIRLLNRSAKINKDFSIRFNQPLQSISVYWCVCHSAIVSGTRCRGVWVQACLWGFVVAPVVVLVGWFFLLALVASKEWVYTLLCYCTLRWVHMVPLVWLAGMLEVWHLWRSQGWFSSSGVRWLPALLCTVFLQLVVVAVETCVFVWWTSEHSGVLGAVVPCLGCVVWVCWPDVRN